MVFIIHFLSSMENRMTNLELRSSTNEELHAKLVKLEKVITGHIQKSMRAKAGGTKCVVLDELERRYHRMDNA